MYRGDAIRDGDHQHVFFEDTATRPTALVALNLTLWWGCMTVLSCADCIQAYLQCDLDDCTWVILPYELWLSPWKKKYDKNEKLAVRLVRSLYGHPLAGNLWQQHLEKVVKSLGVEPIPSFPSNSVFRRGGNGQHTLLLNIYVDDCRLAGGTVEIQRKFWEELRQKVNLEPEEFISSHGTKILGRLHSINRNPNQITMTYDMRLYTQGIIDLYCELTGTSVDKLKQAITPCLPESSMTDTDFETEGILHKHAARILMRCLWLSRLSRPDISFAVGRLTTRVSKWTAWEDRQTLRLISYLNSTKGHMMRAAVEPKAKPEILVFTDSDFASCPYTSRSTSGIIYVMWTGESYFPILWSSKKQASTARSTTEAELIAFAGALFGEALNLHTMAEHVSEQAIPIKFEQDNQAAIAVLQAGYSAKLRHVGRVHRVNIASIHEQLVEENSCLNTANPRCN